jgi:hypothetical protein
VVIVMLRRVRPSRPVENIGRSHDVGEWSPPTIYRFCDPRAVLTQGRWEKRKVEG